MTHPAEASPTWGVLLWEPQDPINIGSVVRACRNTGVRDIRLLRPTAWAPERVGISAPNSEAFIARHVVTHDAWEPAVAGATRLFALTARGRQERQRRFRIHEAIEEMTRLGPDHHVLFVFGREDKGLPNEVVDRCDAYVTLETSDDYRSMNLAQSVMVVLWTVFRALGAPVEMPGPSRQFAAATADHVERMMARVESSLDAVGFFKGDQRENILRTVRRVVLRSQPDAQEVATLFAIFTEVERAARSRGANGAD